MYIRICLSRNDILTKYQIGNAIIKCVLLLGSVWFVSQL